jgi:hypothetical protein
MKRFAQIPRKKFACRVVIVDAAAHPYVEDRFTPSVFQKESIAVD